MMLVYFQKGDVMQSRYEYAKLLDKEVGKLLKNISIADSDAIEDTAHYANISILFLREIMVNTAIIADYCANHSVPDYPNKKERSRAGDSFKETDA